MFYLFIYGKIIRGINIMKKINWEIVKTISIALLFIIMFVINFYITFKLIPSGAKQWYENNILRYAGFSEFWIPKDGNAVVLILSAVLALVIAIVVTVIIFKDTIEAMFNNSIDYATGNRSEYAIALTFCGLLIVFIPVARFLIALLAYLVLYILTPIGSYIISGIFIIFMILVARDMSKKRYILRFWLNVAASIVVAIVFGIIGNNIVNGNISVESINNIFPFLELIKY